MPFTVDPIAAPLARGERPPVWGLNLNAFAQGHADLGETYARWAEAATAVMAGTGAYFYPLEYTHVTASSPAPFTFAPLAGWSEDDRAFYAAAWLTALRDTCAPGAPGWPSAPFPLVFETLELKDNCAIFAVRDDTGGVAAVRAAVAAATRHRALATGRGAELLARANWKTPNIVHSSVMRFAAPRAADVTEDDVREKWARAAALWPGPVTVNAEAMTFIIEAVAYQHITAGEGLLGTFPYA